MKKISALLLLIFIFAPSARAQDAAIIQDSTTTYKARVVRVISEEMRTIPGTDASGHFQKLEAKIIDGDKKGDTVLIDNDYLKLREGQTFYLVRTVAGDTGREFYAVSEPYRLPALAFFTVLFIVMVLSFGGVQGIRGLLSLIGSLMLILYVLLPGVLAGHSPILVSLGVSALIIIVGSYITHGFNKTTTSAVLGMIITVIVTGLLAFWAVKWANLTGFSSEESVYLNFNTRGAIDFVGLLMSGILIGLLGVLYDVAIGQAISVEELHRAGPNLSKRYIYSRTIRIGREHIGALVNTLAIAYVGVSLPLILLYMQSSQASIGIMLNREIFAAEIIRTMIGSIGLVLAVPITIAIAVLILMKDQTDQSASPEEIEREKHALEHIGHHH